MTRMDKIYMFQPNMMTEIEDGEEFLDIYGYIYDYLHHDNVLEQSITKILQEGLDGSSEDKTGTALLWKVGGNIQDGIVRYQYSSKSDQTDGINIAQINGIVHEVYSKYKDAPDKNKLILRDMILQCAKNKEVKHMGAVYTITLVYFMTKGEYPIYDKYAHIALLSLYDNSKKIYTQKRMKEISLEQTDSYKKIISIYSDYKKLSDDVYTKLSVNMDSAESLRRIDKALWAYGHLFWRTKND